MKGLEEQVYGPKAVTNIISGKVVSRALHGHFLVEAVLMLTVLSSCEQNGSVVLVIKTSTIRYSKGYSEILDSFSFSLKVF